MASKIKIQELFDKTKINLAILCATQANFLKKTHESKECGSDDEPILPTSDVLEMLTLQYGIEPNADARQILNAIQEAQKLWFDMPSWEKTALLNELKIKKHV